MTSVGTIGVLFAIIAIADGLRILPANAIVIRRWPFGRWTLPGLADEGRGLRLVSWCIPLALPLVVELGADAETGLSLRRLVARFRARQRRVRRHLLALRALGVATLIALVVGLPWLVNRSGTWGLLVGVVALFALAALQSIVAAAALTRAGLPRRAAVLTSLKFSWPFTAPRAAEEVQRQVVTGMPRLVLLRELLTSDDFESLARPLVYDAMLLGVAGTGTAALVEHLGPAHVDGFLRAAPARGEGDVYCPRCGQTFYRGIDFCSDCSNIRLRSATASVAV